MFNKKRSRKELSKRLLSLDFTVLEQEAASKAEETDEEEDGFFTGTTTVCPKSFDPFLYSKLLYELGQDFLNIQY